MMTSSLKGAIAVNLLNIGNNPARVLLQLFVGNAVEIMRLDCVHLMWSNVLTVLVINFLIQLTRLHTINVVRTLKHKIN